MALSFMSSRSNVYHSLKSGLEGSVYFANEIILTTFLCSFLTGHNLVEYVFPHMIFKLVKIWVYQ